MWMFPASCLKRPLAECLIGVDSGLKGSNSTMYPKRLTSLGVLETSKRSSKFSHLRSDASSPKPKRSRDFCVRLLSDLALAKYWSKFSSPDKMVPHGVTPPAQLLDRKSTRLNSSHVAISYAVFCLKKKNT